MNKLTWKNIRTNTEFLQLDGKIGIMPGIGYIL